MAKAPLDPKSLAARVRAGERRATARALSHIENASPGSEALLEALHPDSGGAHVIGITGPPGAGKSTLVTALVAELRAGGGRVAVLAVDPTSPFSGGAILGDRVRMDAIAADPEVFIRSMATRGSLGGLARTSAEAVIVLAAAGYAHVVVETVGVGQSEVEIASTADCAVVVVSPESGDGIQAMKAGLMEIADVYCVNKADRDGADRIVRELSLASEMSAPRAGWSAPVLRTVARSGEGVKELSAAIAQHRAHLEASGALEALRVERARRRLFSMATERLSAALARGHEGMLDALARDLVARRLAPHAAVARLLEAFAEGGA